MALASPGFPPSLNAKRQPRQQKSSQLCLEVLSNTSVNGSILCCLASSSVPIPSNSAPAPGDVTVVSGAGATGIVPAPLPPNPRDHRGKTTTHSRVVLKLTLVSSTRRFSESCAALLARSAGRGRRVLERLERGLARSWETVIVVPMSTKYDARL